MMDTLYSKRKNRQKINFKTLPGRIYGYRKILSEPIVKVIGKDRQKKWYVSVECIKCGQHDTVSLWHLINNKSRQCDHCKNMKWQPQHVISPNNKEIWKLNMIWRKYKHQFCDEWRTNFDAYAKFIIDDLGWKTGKYKICRINTKQQWSPTNVKISKIKFKK